MHVNISPPRNRDRLVGALLGANAVLLACVLFGQGGPSLVQSAVAAPPPSEESSTGGLISAAEQRKQIITEIKALSDRVGAVETLLKKGLNVKVTEMPPLKLPPEAKPAREKQ